MNRPPFLRGLTAVQLRVFEAIATGHDEGHPGKTLKSLIAKGLIVSPGMRIVGQDRFGLVEVPVYDVPVSLHIEWCMWCSELTGDESCP